VDVRVGTHRCYPFGSLTWHAIGYLSLAGPKDVRAGVLPTEKVGRSGAERLFESELHGKPGAQYEEVDAHGRRVDVFRRIPPVMGRRVRLALDARLQQAASNALGDRAGAVAALDVNTGEVLVLLSKPGFEPNRFITGLEAEQWRAWVNDPRHPLLNRAIQAAYPPASTFKLLVGLAGLRQNAPLAAGATQCPGFLELADRKLRCWKRTGHGRVTLHKAIVRSCDVYFYELGDQLGMPAIGEEAARWGFGRHTGIRLGPEAIGVVPGAKKKAGRRWRRWFRGETMITAIGQGEVSATPLQLARFAAAIANGGRLLAPILVADAPPRVTRVLDVSPAHLSLIRKAMRDVVADPRGTAHAAMQGAPWPVAGKTGTAQVVAKAQDVKGSDAKTLSYLHRDHAWFVGFAPYDRPRIAFAVFVEHGGHGGSAAAPVAAALVRAAAREATPETKPVMAEAEGR
jgi:penicillin-binding protein 2